MGITRVSSAQPTYCPMPVQVKAELQEIFGRDSEGSVGPISNKSSNKFAAPEPQKIAELYKGFKSEHLDENLFKISRERALTGRELLAYLNKANTNIPWSPLGTSLQRDFNTFRNGGATFGFHGQRHLLADILECLLRLKTALKNGSSVYETLCKAIGKPNHNRNNAHHFCGFKIAQLEAYLNRVDFFDCEFQSVLQSNLQAWGEKYCYANDKFVILPQSKAIRENYYRLIGNSFFRSSPVEVIKK